MKWLYCIAFICCFSLLNATVETTIEEKISKLELQSGLEPIPEKTTFILFGDFLYWKASLDGVAWATTAEVVESVTGDNVFDNFKTRTVHFDYSPGFQVGVGIGLPYDHWDLLARWLRTYSTGKDKAHGALTEAVGNRVILDENGLLQELASPPNEAKAHCKVHLDVLDLVLGRSFLWSKYFSFRPFAGVRAAWLKVDWDLSFTMPLTPAPAADQSTARMDIDNHYTAAGLVGGFDSTWNLYSGFGIFSYATASLIYGNSSEKTKEDFFLLPAGQTTVLEQTLTAHNDAHTVKAVYEILAGFKWQSPFYNRYRILLRAGYDFFYWPSVTQKTVVQATRIRDRADLSFQGFVIGARLDF